MNEAVNKKKTSTIYDCIEYLAGSINHIDDSINILINKISPILSPQNSDDPKKEEGEVEHIPKSELAESINELSNIVKIIVYKIQKTASRIEV